MVTRKHKLGIVTFVCAVLLLGKMIPLGAEEHVKVANDFNKLFPKAAFIPQSSSNSFYIAHKFATQPIKGSIVDGGRHFLERYGSLFGLSYPVSTAKFDKSISHLNNSYLRFDQYIEGLPVFERKIIVHVDGKNRIVKVNSTALSSMPKEFEPVLDTVQAYQFATSDIAYVQDQGPVVLGYFPVQDRPVLAYKVVSAAPGPHVWVTYINALTGSKLMRYDMIQRHKAMLYEQNPTVTPDLVEVELENIAAEGEHSFHTYGSLAKVASCTRLSQMGSCSEWRFDALATEENGFMDVQPMLENNPTTGDGFAELMVYNAVTQQNNWYRNTFNFTGQWYDSEQQISNGEMTLSDSLWIYVNADYENGHFMGGFDYPGQQSGAAIVLGNIAGSDLAYDNDVVLHEFGHAVSAVAFNMAMGNLDELGIDMSSGGLEEGQADYFSATTYGNSQIGEYAGVQRILENTNSCPDSLMGESHHDGQIVGGAMWDLRSELGKEKADQLIFGALSGNSMVTFSDFGKAIISQAEWMATRDAAIEDHLRLEEGQVEAVQKAIDGRSIIGCRRVVTLKENGPPIIHFMPFSFGEQGTPSPVQYMFTTGADTTSLELFISSMGDPTHDVLVREGEPIYFNWIEGHSYWDISWEAEYDARFDYNIEEDLPVEIVTLSTITDLELKPNTEYYFSIVCKTNMMSSMGGCQNFLSVRTSSDPIEDPNKKDEVDTEDNREIENDSGIDEEVDGGYVAGDGNSSCDCRAFRPAGGGTTLFNLLAHLTD